MSRTNRAASHNTPSDPSSTNAQHAALHYPRYERSGSSEGSSSEAGEIVPITRGNLQATSKPKMRYFNPPLAGRMLPPPPPSPNAYPTTPSVDVHGFGLGDSQEDVEPFGFPSGTTFDVPNLQLSDARPPYVPPQAPLGYPASFANVTHNFQEKVMEHSQFTPERLPPNTQSSAQREEVYSPYYHAESYDEPQQVATKRGSPYAHYEHLPATIQAPGSSQNMRYLGQGVTHPFPSLSSNDLSLKLGYDAGGDPQSGSGTSFNGSTQGFGQPQLHHDQLPAKEGPRANATRFNSSRSDLPAPAIEARSTSDGSSRPAAGTFQPGPSRARPLQKDQISSPIGFTRLPPTVPASSGTTSAPPRLGIDYSLSDQSLMTGLSIPQANPTIFPHYNHVKETVEAEVHTFTSQPPKVELGMTHWAGSCFVSFQGHCLSRDRQSQCLCEEAYHIRCLIPTYTKAGSSRGKVPWGERLAMPTSESPSLARTHIAPTPSDELRTVTFSLIEAAPDIKAALLSHAPYIPHSDTQCLVYWRGMCAHLECPCPRWFECIGYFDHEKVVQSTKTRRAEKARAKANTGQQADYQT
ncbi:hypothetical protein BKA70DRAFT_1232164 [Coprinopsis sp. MPI-PUGE-AT-0042]|nr:hypothetical protein BKA70DRAFT_1232164 [Coprinopsis sp. MPI-PUGE-AT-0042]